MNLKSLVLSVALIFALCTPSIAAPLSIETINAKLGAGSKLTEIQKDRAWRSFDGKQLTLTGSIEDVSESFGGNSTLTLMLNSGGVQGKKAVVSLLHRFKSKAMNLARGQQVKLMGKIKYFNGIPNMMGMAEKLYGDAYIAIIDASLK